MSSHNNETSALAKRVIDDLLAGEDDSAQQVPKRTKENKDSPITISDSEDTAVPQERPAPQVTFADGDQAGSTQDALLHAGDKPWISQEQQQQQIETVRRHHRQLLDFVQLLPENDTQVRNQSWDDACVAMYDAIMQDLNTSYANKGVDFRLPGYHSQFKDELILEQLEVEYEIAKKKNLSLIFTDADKAAQKIVFRSIDNVWLRAAAVVWLQIAPLVKHERSGSIMIRELSEDLKRRVGQLLEAWQRFDNHANWGPAYEIGGDCLLRIMAVVVRGASRSYDFSGVALLRACLDKAKDMRTAVDSAPTQLGVFQPSAALRNRVRALLESVTSDVENLMDETIDKGIETSSWEPERLEIVKE